LADRFQYLSRTAVAAIACLCLHPVGWAAEKTLGQIEVSLHWKFDTPSDAGRVFLEVVLRNISDSIMFFSEQSDDWDYQIDLVGSNSSSPVEKTNFGKRVLPQPNIIFRNIGRRLEPGGEDHAEIVELNRLFKLDQVGLYRLVVRRRVWVTSISKAQMVLSDPIYIAISAPQVDSSPPANPNRCR